MSSFFPVNAALPRSTSNPSSTPHEPATQDPFAGWDRLPAAGYDMDSQKSVRMPPHPRQRNNFGADNNAAVPIPQASQYGNGRQRNGSLLAGPPPLAVARSPPNPSNKNTKHVPCKFFRQGTCQAGNACPFSHSLDPSGQTQPCKYFMKGTCKFGAKCALLHIYPDGTVANRPGRSVSGPNPTAFGTTMRAAPPPYISQDSVLSNHLLSQQQQPFPPDQYSSQPPFPEHDESDAFYDPYAQFRNMPVIDPDFISPPGSHFGSPPEDSQFPKSPVEQLRTALNAPLPHSFDPNGISHIAQYGRLGESVPDKFGLKSPPASLPKKTSTPIDAVSNLRGTALASNLRNGMAPGSSPQSQEPGGPRVMHSQRAVKANRLSSSVPQGGPLDDWDDDLNFDADLLPNSVRDEVLTPQEKMRRLSRAEQDGSSSRDPSNGLAIPSGGSSKVGSPSMSYSPSRYRAIFEQQQQQREKKEQESNSTTNGQSAFGHVGSPLRESWLPDSTSNGSLWPSSLSGISQQMARMQLNRIESTDSNGRLQPPGLRNASGAMGKFERTISSPGVTSTKIDEEGEGLLFSMDDENSKRSSLNWDGKSPRLGPMNDATNRLKPIDIKESGNLHANGGNTGFGFRS